MTLEINSEEFLFKKNFHFLLRYILNKLLEKNNSKFAINLVKNHEKNI